MLGRITAPSLLALLVLEALLFGRASGGQSPPRTVPFTETGAAASPDVLAAALAEVGLDEAAVGQRPLASWNRYPHPDTVPHVLPFFADLHARPLDTYEFARTLGNAVERLLGVEALAGNPDALFDLGVLLATERRIGGFRPYGANLRPSPAATEPLLGALLLLHERAARPLSRSAVFGKDDAHDQDPVALLRAEVAKVPAALAEPLARLVLNLVEARTWADRGLRRVPQHLRDAVFDAAPRLADVTPGGREYLPAVDDVARLIDEHSLWYGCLKALQAVQDARREIAAVPVPAGGWPPFAARVGSPWGELAFGSGEQGEAPPADPFLIVRLGGAGPVGGPLGATDRRRTLSVALLLDGAPRVGCPPDAELSACRGAAVASGILGCGIVYAAGKGDTMYRGSDWGLGAGLFGLGALVDEGGDDDYRMRSVGMGAAFFGAGLLLDAAGSDRYALEGGDGQGYGGPGGIGILADRWGDDTYYAEPDPAKAGRADYHSDDRVAVSFAQGVGVGRRGDGTDGHAWAGGLGALIDVEGDDRYRAGNFSLGTGYWLGTGLLWDGGGDDEYRSVFYTQGSGAHFAIGALIDEGGDDLHVVDENAALGFGWDVVNGLLIDRGAGNDRYEARTDALGAAMLRSHAFFLDEGGDDTYVLAENGNGLGYADRDERYERPGPTSTFQFHLGQAGVFLDAGGDDAYLRRGKGGVTSPDAEAGNDQSWHVRKRAAGSRSGPNVSAGKDVPGGRFGFLDPWPRTSE